MSELLRTIRSSIRDLFYFAILVVLFVFIFALIGVDILKDKMVGWSSYGQYMYMDISLNDSVDINAVVVVSYCIHLSCTYRIFLKVFLVRILTI